MKFEILNSEVDVQIKSDLYRFLEGVYIGNGFSKEQNDYALKLSFFLIKLLLKNMNLLMINLFSLMVINI